MFEFLMIAIMASPAWARVDCSTSYKSWLAVINLPDTSATRTKKDEKLRNVRTCEDSRYASKSQCTSAESDFKEAITKITDKCGENNLKSTSEAGTIACSAAVDRCACVDKKTTPFEKVQMKCPGKISPSETKHCGSVSEGQAERLAKKIDQAETRLEKARDKVSKLDDEKEKSEGSLADKMKEARRAKTAAQSTYDQSMLEAKNAAAASQKEMYASMNGIREKVFGVQQQLVESKEKDSAAYSAMLEQKVKIEMQCSAQATAAISSAATEAVANLRTGTYNRGSQEDIFREVGMTDRQSWQKKAAQRKKWCMESEPVKESFTSASRAYQDNLRANAASRQTAYDQISMLNGQMAQLQNPNGSCTATAGNGAAMQTEFCRGANEAKEKERAAFKARAIAFSEAAQDEKEAYAAVQKAAGSKGRQHITATTELEEAEANLKTLKEQEKLAESYVNSPNPEAARDLDISMDELIDRSGGLNFCCNYGHVENGDLCKKAVDFLNREGYKTELLKPPGSTPPGSAPAAPITTPAPVTGVGSAGAQ